MFPLIFLYAVFAGTFSLGKLILPYTQPIFVIGLRMSIAGFLIVAYQHFIAKTTFHLRKDHWLIYLKMMLFTVFIPYILRGWGLGYMSSCKASFLYNFGPFISYLLSCVLYAEQVRSKKVLGLMIGFVGLLPMIFSQAYADPHRVCSLSFLPDIAMILSVSFISYGWLMAHHLIRRYHYPPTLISGIGMLGGGLLALVASFIVEDRAAYIIDPFPFITILAIIIVMSNLICHNLYATLLKKYTPTMMSFASFMTPFFAGLYGFWFMAEKITWHFIASNSIVAIGLALFYYEELRQVNIRPSIKPATKEQELELVEAAVAPLIEGEVVSPE